MLMQELLLLLLQLLLLLLLVKMQSLVGAQYGAQVQRRRGRAVKEAGRDSRR